MTKRTCAAHGTDVNSSFSIRLQYEAFTLLEYTFVFEAVHRLRRISFELFLPRFRNGQTPT